MKNLGKTTNFHACLGVVLRAPGTIPRKKRRTTLRGEYGALSPACPSVGVLEEFAGCLEFVRCGGSACIFSLVRIRVFGIDARHDFRSGLFVLSARTHLLRKSWRDEHHLSCSAFMMRNRVDIVQREVFRTKTTLLPRAQTCMLQSGVGVCISVAEHQPDNVAQDCRIHLGSDSRKSAIAQEA